MSKPNLLMVVAMFVWFAAVACEKKSRNVEIEPNERDQGLQTGLSCDRYQLADGQSTTLLTYTVDQVNYGELCSDHAREVTVSCANGSVSFPEGTPSFFTCSEKLPKDCGSENLLHGASKTIDVYMSATVPYGDTCDSVKARQTVSCEDGAITRDNLEYTHQSCAVEPAASCEQAGLADGESKLIEDQYSAEEVPYGQRCEDIKGTRKITCVNGNISEENAQFKYENCTPEPAKNCGVTEHGDDFVEEGLYSAEQANAPQTCDSLKGKRVRTCDNGLLLKKDGTEFKFETCKDQNQAQHCPGDGLENGQSKSYPGFLPKMFLQAGFSCDEIKGSVTMTCEEGNTVISSGSEYAESTCDDTVELPETQFWMVTDVNWVAPWKTATPDRAMNSTEASVDTLACEAESKSALKTALTDSELRKLIAKAIELGGTEVLTILVSDSGTSMALTKRRDRGAYYWHWNQDKRTPSVASSNYKLGTWVWESSLSNDVCTHPSVDEMKRYLRYSIKRLEGMQLLK
ncbi:MAG: hypothetical protein HRU19_18385 [Pseudobacteriovorax sp.]|nr:hypothetical protein [Pseudobacteriovorax sp.]